MQRWLKMTKYLPEYGWKPVVYTPLNPDASVEDESLIQEVGDECIVLKRKIWEPYDIYRKFSKKKGEKFKAGYVAEASSNNWKDRLSVFLRGNLLIPDPRMFWIRPSVKYLTNFLKDTCVDAIVTTGPPHSMHLIGMGLKKQFPNIKWIADFRDPWTDIDFYSKLKLTKWADKKHHRLEKQVLSKADHVVTVSPSWQSDLQRKRQSNVELVYNGFDHADYPDTKSSLDKSFSICHLGTLNKDRNPHALWQALGQLCKDNKAFKENLQIKLIGQTSESVFLSIKKHKLTENLLDTPHMPHKEGLRNLRSSQVLLLPINNADSVMGILPGKMYEYMATQRPILAIGPADADFAKIIAETNLGRCFDFDQSDEIKRELLSLFQQYLEGKLNVSSGSLEKFSRKSQAANYCKILEF